jgi:cysteine desulfurase
MLAFSSMERHYFDHNATTPLATEALEAMLPCLREVYGNASSIHDFGQKARLVTERARRQVASLLNAKPVEIVFTSGGTESDNLAILGVVRGSPGGRKHVITSTIEHPAVLSTCKQLEAEGCDVSYVRVGANGVVDPGDVRVALRPETVLISIMHANNEIGTLQPVEEIAKIAREAGVLFHSDGVQSVGKRAVDVNRLGVDLYSLSAHKIYGPKGVGALYVRKGVKLHPVQFGGHHERDRRPGTENVPGIAGLGAAAELMQATLSSESARVGALRDRLEREILARVEFATVNAGGSPRVPNTTNICFDFVEGEAMVIGLDLRGMAVSSGAACSSGAVEPSHVLTAIGLSKERARSSMRFSLGKQNTEAEIGALIEAVPAVVEHLRKLSPARAAKLA